MTADLRIEPEGEFDKIPGSTYYSRALERRVRELERLVAAVVTQRENEREE